MSNEPSDMSLADRSQTARALWHPEDVVSDPDMSVEAKRALLASWASDACAVADFPTLRRLENGATVSLNAIQDAMKALDGAAGHKGADTPAYRPAELYRSKILLDWRKRSVRRSKARHDDDDPPPGAAALRSARPMSAHV